MAIQCRRRQALMYDNSGVHFFLDIAYYERKDRPRTDREGREGE
jgi:hypothetical protein